MAADQTSNRRSIEDAAVTSSPAQDLKFDQSQASAINSDSGAGERQAIAQDAPHSTPKAGPRSSFSAATAPRADKGTPPKPPPHQHGSEGLNRPQRSLPVSMIVRPSSNHVDDVSSTHPGELEESFESALARVEPLPDRTSVWARLTGLLRKLGLSGGRDTNFIDPHRTIAFDGFHDSLFEEKRERDRRYGTVYAVAEHPNAFVVKLELPRRMPRSALKATWEVPDEMPDYICQLRLDRGVLTIRAGLPDEARRRLSYISTSFPPDFQTRIEFPLPVEGYKHRVLNKTLEVIVFKKRDTFDTRSVEQ